MRLCHTCMTLTFALSSSLPGVQLHFVPDAVLHMRLRHTLRGTYNQARDWAVYRVKLCKKLSRVHGDGEPTGRGSAMRKIGSVCYGNCCSFVTSKTACGLCGDLARKSACCREPQVPGRAAGGVRYPSSALSILKIRVPSIGPISETGENQGGFPWKKRGIRLRRDSWVSVMYAEGLNSDHEFSHPSEDRPTWDFGTKAVRICKCLCDHGKTERPPALPSRRGCRRAVCIVSSGPWQRRGRPSRSPGCGKRKRAGRWLHTPGRGHALYLWVSSVGWAWTPSVSFSLRLRLDMQVGCSPSALRGVMQSVGGAQC